MLKKVFRLIARLAVLGSLVYLVRGAMKRWIDGPEPAPAPTGRQWAAGTEAPRVAPPANPPAPEPAGGAQAVTGGPAPAESQAAPEPQRSGPARRSDRPLRADRPLKAARSDRPLEANRPVKAQPAAASGDGDAPAGKRRPRGGPQDGAQVGPGGTWVAPDASGAAPVSHPVKVKLSSGLYREPGSSNYARTRPDRCYVSAEAAEADGFTRARR